MSLAVEAAELAGVHPKILKRYDKFVRDSLGVQKNRSEAFITGLILGGAIDLIWANSPTLQAFDPHSLEHYHAGLALFMFKHPVASGMGAALIGADVVGAIQNPSNPVLSRLIDAGNSPALFSPGLSRSVFFSRIMSPIVCFNSEASSARCCTVAAARSFWTSSLPRAFESRTSFSTSCEPYMEPWFEHVPLKKPKIRKRAVSPAYTHRNMHLPSSRFSANLLGVNFPLVVTRIT